MIKPGQFILMTALLSLLIGCSDDNSKMIEYPEMGKYGPNLLDQNKTIYSAGYSSMCAILEDNEQIRVKIKGDPWWFNYQQVSPYWQISEYINESREFTSIVTGTVDAEIELVRGALMEITVFENDDPDPVWTKTFTVQ